MEINAAPQDAATGDTNMQNELNKIAKDILGLDTLETRNSDAHDFSDQPVWSLQQALEAAFKAGQKSAGASADHTDSLRAIENLLADWPTLRNLSAIGAQKATDKKRAARSIIKAALGE